MGVKESKGTMVVQNSKSPYYPIWLQSVEVEIREIGDIDFPRHDKPQL